MRSACLGLALAGVLSVASTARAEEKKPIEVSLSIRSRVPRPMAAIEVRRVVPALGVGELGKSPLKRIEEVVSKEPF